jgi:galactose-1-phosphate uridylyltransferase
MIKIQINWCKTRFNNYSEILSIDTVKLIDLKIEYRTNDLVLLLNTASNIVKNWRNKISFIEASANSLTFTNRNLHNPIVSTKRICSGLYEM